MILLRSAIVIPWTRHDHDSCCGIKPQTWGFKTVDLSVVNIVLYFLLIESGTFVTLLDFCSSSIGWGSLHLRRGSVTGGLERSSLALCSKSIAPTLAFELASVPRKGSSLRLNSAFLINKLLELMVFEVEQTLRLKRPETTEPASEPHAMRFSSASKLNRLLAQPSQSLRHQQQPQLRLPLSLLLPPPPLWLCET